MELQKRTLNRKFEAELQAEKKKKYRKEDKKMTFLGVRGKAPRATTDFNGKLVHIKQPSAVKHNDALIRMTHEKGAKT